MNPYEIYQRKQQQTIEKPEDLLLATFEELVSKLNMIAFAIEEKDIETKVTLIKKVVDALEILRASLDREVDEKLTQNLDDLYAFCIDEITKANITNEVEYVENAKEILTTLMEGFKEAQKNVTTKTSAAS